MAQESYLERAKQSITYHYQICHSCLEIVYMDSVRLGYIILNRKGEYVAIFNFGYLTSQYVSSDNIENVKLFICKTVANVLENNLNINE